MWRQKENIGEGWSRQSLEPDELTAQGDKVALDECVLVSTCIGDLFRHYCRAPSSASSIRSHNQRPENSTALQGHLLVSFGYYPCKQGRPSPWDHDAFPPCFRFPLFSKNFQTEESFQNFTFSRQISWFSSTEISDDLFLVIDKKFWIYPSIFWISIHVSPRFRENYSFPHTFQNFPLFS